MGWALLGLAAIESHLYAQHTQKIGAEPLNGIPSAQPPDADLEGASLAEALKTAAFWVYSLAVSFQRLISSGIFLFNEEIFKDRDIAPKPTTMH